MIKSPGSGSIIAFLLGAVVMAVIAYAVFDWRPFGPTVKMLKTDVTTEYAGSLEISQAEAKLTPIKSGQTAVAVKFTVKNMHSSEVSVQASVTLFDKNGFELGQRVVSSDSGQGDFSVGESRPMFIEIGLAKTEAQSLNRAKILGRSLKTAAQIQEERQAKVQESQKKVDEILAANRRAQAAIAAKWEQLEKGMSKSVVESLLGKPTSVRSNYFGEHWEYEGSSYLRSNVDFGKQGFLESWNYR